MKDMINSVKFPPPQPLFVNVGTRSTLSCLLSTMNVTDPDLTQTLLPYGSAIIFELHELNGKHFVNALYRSPPGASGNTTDAYRMIPIPNVKCDENNGMCPFEEFIK